MSELRFLFGRPVLPCKPSADGSRRLFVLGAYPSALHIRWRGTNGASLIRAVAVDNEPEPFWTGHDQGARVKMWAEAIGWREQWGMAQECKSSNGTSGCWVENRLLRLMKVSRAETWITDCLDTYFESEGAARRLSSDKLAALVQSHGIPAAHHHRHPSEEEIVRLSLAGHRERLLSELDAARPERVVTLGNAALRVFTDLIGLRQGPRELSLAGYGESRSIQVLGRPVEWIPLAHPGARVRWQDVHTSWLNAMTLPTAGAR